MNQIRKASRAGAATALALLLSITVLAGCGGGSSGSDSGGVASIDASKSSKTDDSSKSSKDSEQELLDYTKCLRKQGLDVPDPEVDANGNLQLGGPGGGGPSGGAPGDGGQQIDRSAMEKAQKVCGDLPDSVTQQFDDVDQTEMQDTILEYAKCMRENGVDMPDPDFSNIGTPGSGPGDGQDGGPGGGPFGDVDRDDPAFKKASEACQSLLAGIGPGRSTTTEAN